MAKTNVSRLTQIYRAEKTKGRGLGSAIGKATLEKIDPRQFFNQQGLLASIFPSLFKAYKAPTQSEVSKTSPTALQFSTIGLENKIDDLSTHAKISAKNSLVLPSMARDMNLTRQNIARLVKLQGGKPSYKSDMFFMRAAEREAAYESQFKKQRPVMAAGTKPTATKTEESGPSFFDKLLKGLAIGGLIGGLIYGAFQMLKDKVQKFYDDTVKQIEDIYTDIKKVVMDKFNQVKEKISNIMDEITVDNLKQAAQNFFNGLLNAIKNLPSGFGGTAGSITSGGESPENPSIVPATSSIGLGAAQAEAERAKKMGPKGEKVETVNGVIGYYQTVGQGRGTQGKKFVALQGESLVNYYEKEIKRVEDLLGGETLTSAQLSAQSFASTEAGKVAIERYLKQKGSPTLTPIQTPTLPTPTAAEFQKGDKDVTPTGAAPIVAPTPTTNYPEQRFPNITFRMLTKEQQDAVMQKQFEKEGNKPGNLAHDLNNPGAMLYDDNLGKLFGATKNPNRGEGKLKGEFAQFPTLQAGFEAQRWKWLNAPIKGKDKYGDLPLDKSINLWTTGKIEGTANPKEAAGIENYKKGLYAAAGYEYTGPSVPVQMAAANIPQTRSMVTTPTTASPSITPVAAAPTIPSNIQTTIKSDGTKLGAATIEVAQARVQIGSAPIVVSPPTVNVQAPQVQASMGSMGSASSVVDSEFMKLLVGRTVTL